jgi:hypothetical protein
LVPFVLICIKDRNRKEKYLRYIKYFNLKRYKYKRKIGKLENFRLVGRCE